MKKKVTFRVLFSLLFLFVFVVCFMVYIESSNIYGQLFKQKEIHLKGIYTTYTYYDSSDIGGINIILTNDDDIPLKTLENLSIGRKGDVANIFKMSSYDEDSNMLGYLHINDLKDWKDYNPKKTTNYKCTIFGPDDKKVNCVITFNPKEYEKALEKFKESKKESEEIDSETETDSDNDSSDSSSLEDVIDYTFNPGENALNLLSYQRQLVAGSQFSILFPGTLSDTSLIIKDGTVGYSFCIPAVEDFDGNEIDSVIVDDEYNYDHNDADGDQCMFSVVNGKIQLLTYDSAAAMHFADNFTVKMSDIYGNEGTKNVPGVGSDILDMIDNFNVAQKYKNKNLYDYVNE